MIYEQQFRIYASYYLKPRSINSYVSYIKKVCAVTGTTSVDWGNESAIERVIEHPGLTPKQARDGRSAIRMYMRMLENACIDYPEDSNHELAVPGTGPALDYETILSRRLGSISDDFDADEGDLQGHIPEREDLCRPIRHRQHQ